MSTAPPTSSLSRVLLTLLGVAALVAALLYVLGGRPAPGQHEVRARGRAAAFFHKDQMSAARDALASHLLGDSPSLDLLCDAAAIEFAAGELDVADALLDRAAAVDPDAARLTFLRGQLLRVRGDYEAALPYFERTHETLPGDLPTLLCLADVQHGLDLTAEAEATLRKVIAVGPENGTAWYYSAIYRMSRIMQEEARDDEADRYFAVLSDLQAAGYDPPTDTDVSRGTLGKALSPEPAGTTPRAPFGLSSFAPARTVLVPLRAAQRLQAPDLDGDGDLDLLACGPGGVQLGIQDGEEWTAVLLTTSATSAAVACDMDNDGDQDVIASTADGVLVFRQSEGGFPAPTDVTWPALPGPARDVTAIDFDHEGDLDLIFVGEFGTRIWRNDGVASEAGGAFTDFTAEGLDHAAPCSRVVAEDLDVDQDVDLILDGRIASSRRGGRFEERATRLPASPAACWEDFDGDGYPDRAALVNGELVLAFGPDFESTVVGPAAGTIDALFAVDADLDGAADVFWRAGEPLARGLLAVGHESRRTEAAFPAASAGTALVIADLDGDGDVDAACSTDAGIELHDAISTPAPSLRLTLRGVRDNRSGVGAVIEVRSTDRYRRLFWDGTPTSIGLGSEDIDILRIVWPNGVLQEDLDLDLLARTSLETKSPESFGHYEQVKGLVGSCPFLYTWNGETFEFISDVLGITPLGLPMAPGMLVPPDHDEYVLVTGEQLVEKDGFLTVQFTEELREVTYLDRIRLHAIDHPADTEIQPDERFCFPPFPEHHVHTIREPLAPTKAIGSDGEDWTTALAAIDGDHAAPFEPYAQQFMGLAPPHFVELSFDAEAVRDAEKLRLLLTGWLFWTNASINMASAYHEGVSFMPPMIQVPDGHGGWRETGPPVGFPAGKTKTMVLDVSELLVRDDPRLRVVTSLDLYWDRILLAVDDDDAPYTEHVLEPAFTNLWDRGFSAPLLDERDHQPERFDWDVLADHPRWNQHPGMYTRYGDVAPLLSAVDDKFCILGTGDALEVRFDARELPPLTEGMRRDYLIFLDGWAKDRDPNTLQALEVEPLPFHGMSGYPYGPDETFPTDEEHEDWRREWNTRPARRWIRPLAPMAEAEWLLDG